VAQLDLDDGEPLGGGEGLLLHLVGCADADGEGGLGGAVRVETEKTVDRNAQLLADQVVEGDVNGSLRRTRARGQAGQDVLDEEGIVGQGEGGQVVQHLGLSFVVLADRRGFAVAFVLAVREADEHVFAAVAGAVGDAEGHF